ncbi:MAG: hypothetical protein IMY67_09595, partial [Bacteroidetes bacterium]|nr:hypothetical protein [Bacteroidota bacterium]
MKNFILSILFFSFVLGTYAQTLKSNSSEKEKKEDNSSKRLHPVQLSNSNDNETNSLAKLIEKKSSNYVITSEHISSTSGVRHIYLRQAINGLEVFGTESSIHIDANKKVIASHNNFIKEINASVKSSSVGISAKQAVISVSQQMGYSLSNLQNLEPSVGINQKSIFNKAGISGTEIPVKLMYYCREGIGT